MDEGTLRTFARPNIGGMVLSAFKGGCFLVQAEFTFLLIGPVTLQAMSCENGLDVFFEIDRSFRRWGQTCCVQIRAPAQARVQKAPATTQRVIARPRPRWFETNFINILNCPISSKRWVAGASMYYF